MSAGEQRPDTAPLQLDRRPTMSDVAALAGVSRQLVSLVLRREPGPSEASRKKVLRAAAELDFHPHASAQLLRQNRTMTIGVCFVLKSVWMGSIIESLFSALRPHGYRLALAPSTFERPQDVAIGELMEQRVEALVAFNPDPTSAALTAAIGRIPVVWLGERDPLQRCDNVYVDEYQGLRQVVEHLTGLGHTRIAYAGGLEGNAGPDRLDAYVVAMRDAGLTHCIDVVEGGFDDEDGARAARTLLERRALLPTALVCSSDQSAGAAVTTFARAGLRVPQDVSVVGFDDSRLAALSSNDLTTVRQDVDLVARATAEILVARLSGVTDSRRVRRIPTSLVHRSSVAEPREHDLHF